MHDEVQWKERPDLNLSLTLSWTGDFTQVTWHLQGAVYSSLQWKLASLVAQIVKNPPAMKETHLIPGSGRSPGEENGYTLHILAWRNGDLLYTDKIMKISFFYLHWIFSYRELHSSNFIWHQ